MGRGVEETVIRVVEAMRDNLAEPFAIDDMARIAMFSKFHFSRVFQDVTGTSPGRFLTALRLAEAKRLLLTTGLSVAEVSVAVGYSSVGTFSSRFKGSVGVAPSVFRASGGFRPRPPLTGSRPVGGTTMTGIVGPGPGHQGTVFVGLFRDVLPQGLPVRCQCLPGPGAFELTAVPQGTWHLLAFALPPVREDGAEPCPPAGIPTTALVAAAGPIVVTAGERGRRVDLTLRRSGPLDPPVLLAPVALAPDEDPYSLLPDGHPGEVAGEPPDGTPPGFGAGAGRDRLVATRAARGGRGRAASRRGMALARA